MNSFGDRPYDADKPVVLHNSDVLEYLETNVREFALAAHIRFEHKVCVGV